MHTWLGCLVGQHGTQAKPPLMGLPVRIQPQVLVELCEYRKATVSGLISTDKIRFAAAAERH